MTDAPNSLSGKVTLDTTDYKTGVAELSRQIKIIESGFKAASAGMEDWSKTSVGVEARQKALTQVIDIQRQKIALLSAAYQDVVSKKGADSKAAQDLQVRINNETAALNKNQLELSQVAAGTKKVAAEQKTTLSATDSLKLGMIAFNQTLEAVQKVLETGKKIYEATIAATEKYDLTILKLSRDTGTSTDEMSRLYHVSEAAGVPIDSLTGAFDMLQKRGLTPSIATIGQVSDKFLSMSDSQERTKYMVELLGKNWTTLIPLLMEGSAKIEENAAKVEHANIVTAEAAANADAYRRANVELQDSFEALTHAVSGGFIPILTAELDKLSLRMSIYGAVASGYIDIGTAVDLFRTSMNGTKTTDELVKELNDDLAKSPKWIDEQTKSLAKNVEALGKDTTAIDANTQAQQGWNQGINAHNELTGENTRLTGYLAEAEANRARETARLNEIEQDNLRITQGQASAQKAESDEINNLIGVAKSGIAGWQSAYKTFLAEITNFKFAKLIEWATKSGQAITEALFAGEITQKQADKLLANVNATVDKDRARIAAGKPVEIPMTWSYIAPKPVSEANLHGNSPMMQAAAGTPVTAPTVSVPLTAVETANFLAAMADYWALKDKTVTTTLVTKNVSTGGGKTWHPGYIGPNGKWIDGYWAAGGMDEIVPQGFPNDSAVVHVSSGERVTVTPANQVGSIGGPAGRPGRAGGDIIYNVVINDAMAWRMFQNQARLAGKAQAEKAMQ